MYSMASQTSSSPIPPYPETIAVAPVTQIVPFNIGDNVTFSCEVIGSDALIWEFNGIQLQKHLGSIGVFIKDGISNGQSENTTRINSTLLVTMNPGYDRNASTVRCFPKEMAAQKDEIEVAYLRTYGRSFGTPCFHLPHPHICSVRYLLPAI